MPLVNISLNGRSYEMACGEGQEAHLRGLAAKVSERMNQLVKANGQIDEARLLVMASILLAEDLSVEASAHAQTKQRLVNAQHAVERSAESGGSMEKATSYIADVFDDISNRLEKVADRIEA